MPTQMLCGRRLSSANRARRIPTPIVSLQPRHVLVQHTLGEGAACCCPLPPSGAASTACKPRMPLRAAGEPGAREPGAPLWHHRRAGGTAGMKRAATAVARRPRVRRRKRNDDKVKAWLPSLTAAGIGPHRRIRCFGKGE